MHETPSELTELQARIDESYVRAGDHLLSIHTASRRMMAEDVVHTLQGVCIFNLATVNRSNEPIVAPIDGLFLGGILWFGSSKDSVRFTHIRRNPSVSAAYTRGEEISILIHGIAHEIDTLSGNYERFHDYCREIYGPNYDNLGFWETAPFAWVEARRFYAADMGSGA